MVLEVPASSSPEGREAPAPLGSTGLDFVIRMRLNEFIQFHMPWICCLRRILFPEHIIQTHGIWNWMNSLRRIRITKSRPVDPSGAGASPPVKRMPAAPGSIMHPPSHRAFAKTSRRYSIPGQPCRIPLDGLKSTHTSCQTYFGCLPSLCFYNGKMVSDAVKQVGA